MVGSHNNGKFTAAKDTKIGTITQKSMLQLCKVDSIDQLTDRAILDNWQPLQDKLTSKVKQNLNALYNQLQFIANMPSECHLFRISSGLLPLFDHPQFNVLYDVNLCRHVDVLLARCKRLIDSHGIRVCTHPDQYTVINSDKEEVRQKAFTALYYHKYFMERLTTADQTSINIHLNGKLDHIPEFDQGLYSDLIPWLSFENEDKTGSVFVADTYNTLAVCERYGVKMLFDIHHHHVMTGDHISVNDSVIDRIVATWQGVRPIFHLSQGKDHATDKKHSDFISCPDLIAHSSNYLYLGDIEIEAKAKTSAVLNYYNSVR